MMTSLGLARPARADPGRCRVHRTVCCSPYYGPAVKNSVRGIKVGVRPGWPSVPKDSLSAGGSRSTEARIAIHMRRPQACFADEASV